MRRAMILAALLLAGCDRRAELLEQDYAKAATTVDQCRIAKQIADVYLQNSDADGYKRWSMRRDSDCLLADTGIYSPM